MQVNPLGHGYGKVSAGWPIEHLHAKTLKLAHQNLLSMQQKGNCCGGQARKDFGCESHNAVRNAAPEIPFKRSNMVTSCRLGQWGLGPTVMKLAKENLSVNVTEQILCRSGHEGFECHQPKIDISNLHILLSKGAVVMQVEL